jgi:hypothetical protein
VYRVDDVVSGRITPTFDVVVTFGGALLGGALAEDFGGLVSLQIALTFLLLPPELLEELPELPELLLPPLLHAARARVAAAPSAAATVRLVLRIVAPFP